MSIKVILLTLMTIFSTGIFAQNSATDPCDHIQDEFFYRDCQNGQNTRNFQIKANELGEQNCSRIQDEDYSQECINAHRLRINPATTNISILSNFCTYVEPSYQDRCDLSYRDLYLDQN